MRIFLHSNSVFSHSIRNRRLPVQTLLAAPPDLGIQPRSDDPGVSRVKIRKKESEYHGEGEAVP